MTLSFADTVLLQRIEQKVGTVMIPFEVVAEGFWLENLKNCYGNAFSGLRHDSTHTSNSMSLILSGTVSFLIVQVMLFQNTVVWEV